VLGGIRREKIFLEILGNIRREKILGEKMSEGLLRADLRRFRLGCLEVNDLTYICHVDIDLKVKMLGDIRRY
jgi:hypothetical protein